MKAYESSTCTCPFNPPRITDEYSRGGVPCVRVEGCGNFSVHKTFDCGQAFRFDPSNGCDDSFSGTAFGKRITFTDLGGGIIEAENSTADEFSKVWMKYLSLDADYDEADRAIIDAMPNDRDRAEMTAAVNSGRGIRILRQEPFETLISFIISQNNNIPRIKKIIAAMCGMYGCGNAFPTADALVDAGEDGIFALKTGFRAKYIYDAALKVKTGEIVLDDIAKCDDYGKCTEMLCSIKGVGPKVSSCVLLFGFGKTEAFPIDVWMKKSLALHFPNGFDPDSLGKYAGIAQQYMFYHERWINSQSKG